jgi:hypothetical protein
VTVVTRSKIRNDLPAFGGVMVVVGVPLLFARLFSFFFFFFFFFVYALLFSPRFFLCCALKRQRDHVNDDVDVYNAQKRGCCFSSLISSHFLWMTFSLFRFFLSLDG